MDIEGKAALVTGPNRSLGRAFAAALLQAGASKGLRRGARSFDGHGAWPDSVSPQRSILVNSSC